MGLHLSQHRVNGIFNNIKENRIDFLNVRSLKSLSLFPYSTPLQVTCTGLSDIVTDALPGR